MSNAKQIDQLLEGFLKRGLPGCGLKVVQYGNTLYEGYFGVTDIDTKTPATFIEHHHNCVERNFGHRCLTDQIIRSALIAWRYQSGRWKESVLRTKAAA